MVSCCLDRRRRFASRHLELLAVKLIKPDRPGTAGVPACPRREEPTQFYRWGEIVVIG